MQMQIPMPTPALAMMITTTVGEPCLGRTNDTWTSLRTLTEALSTDTPSTLDNFASVWFARSEAVRLISRRAVASNESCGSVSCTWKGTMPISGVAGEGDGEDATLAVNAGSARRVRW